MAKLSRGTTRSGGGKKKAKKRSEPAPVAHGPRPDAAMEPAHPRGDAGDGSSASVLQFRPRPRETGAGRPMGRAATSGRALLQAIDYSYVFTDLKIIGLLSLVLFGVLIALSFVVR